jgi:hypothetical protein
MLRLQTWQASGISKSFFSLNCLDTEGRIYVPGYVGDFFHPERNVINLYQKKPVPAKHAAKPVQNCAIEAVGRGG